MSTAVAINGLSIKLLSLCSMTSWGAVVALEKTQYWKSLYKNGNTYEVPDGIKQGLHC